MKQIFSRIRVEWVVASFCAWHAAGLVQAWRHSPYDRLGWVALMLWFAPALPVWWRSGATVYQFRLAVIGLALALFGVIGDLNFLIYWGLAASLGAIAGVSRRAWLWVLLAVCWMPVFGWAASQSGLSPGGTAGLRVFLALIAAGLGGRRLQPVPDR